MSESVEPIEYTIEDYKKPEIVKEINEVRLPIIFNRIYEILSPKY